MKHFQLMLAVLAIGAGPIFGADAPDEAETAIRKAIDSYVTAFNKGDAKALAAHWTEQGEFVTPAGKELRGRPQLEEDFAVYFAETKNAKIELLDTSIKVASPSVALETGTARVVSPDAEPSETIYKAIHVKTAEGWKIDSVREEAPAAPAPTHYEQLKDLEWMIGEWVDTDDNAPVETTCRWSTNNNFLIRSFRVNVQDRIDFEGTQVIGWDPAAQTIRSWLFDSDGGFGVGRWTGGDGRWTVQTLSVLPDGRRASATSIHEIVDENSFRFQSIGRQVDGELLPNIDPVTVVRRTAP
jgi:uncharacterized protein (TIGR02246 family)